MRRLGLCLVALSACVSTGSPDEDPIDATFDAELAIDAKADVRSLSDLRCAVLETANTATLDQLEDAWLSPRTARAIVAHRLGDDGLPGSRDDRFFTSLVSLDGVDYVGPLAFARLAHYALATGIECGEVEVQLLATNDFHGNLVPPLGSAGRIVTGADPNVDRVEAGGAAFLAAHLARLEAESAGTTVTVAAGDIIGATPLLSALFHDEPTIESMNLAGLDIAGVGNHEFDEGPAELLRMQEGGCHPVDGCQDGDDFTGAAFQYLSANVVVRATGETLFAPYTVRSFGNARVAFLGLTLEGTPQVVTPSAVASLEFRDEVETVNALVPELRAQGIEAIVVLLHEGGFTTGRYDGCDGISGPVFAIAAMLDPSVDVVVSGHTNAAHVCDIDGKLITSAAAFGRLVTDIDLVIDERTGQIVSRTARNVIVTRDVAPSAPQNELIAKYQALSGPLANRVVGRITAEMTRAPNEAGESLMGDVIADAQLAATRGDGAQIAFMNPGGVRGDLVLQSSGGEAIDEVTYGELFTVQPFGNTLVTITLTGAELEAVLEQQWGPGDRQMILSCSAGLRYVWDAARPIGDRVSDITLEGAPIDPAREYRVTVNSFLAAGGDGFSALTSGRAPLGGGNDVDVLEAHLHASSPLAPPRLERIVRR